PPATYPLSLHAALPISDVVEAVARIVRRQELAEVDLDCEQITHGVRVLVAVEAVEGHGAPGVRRCSRGGYANAVRDLLAVEIDLDRKSTRLNSSHVKIS